MKEIFVNLSCTFEYCLIEYYVLFVCLKVFNATFNDISFTSWQSVLLVASHYQTLSHSVVHLTLISQHQW
jgi:hypothetical protein